MKNLFRKIYNKLSFIIFNNISKEYNAYRIGVKCDPKKIFIYGNVSFGTEPWIIKLGSNVHITNGVSFLTHDGGTLLFRDKYPDVEITAPIEIGNNVYIGFRSILLPGIKVGSNVVIGAGSIVTKDLPDGFVYAGNPAKRIKSIDEYKEKILKNSLKLGHLKGKLKDNELRKYFRM